SRAWAAGPSPMWKLDLTQFGYKACIYKGQTATVHFVRHFLVVEWGRDRSLSHGEACAAGKDTEVTIAIDSLTAARLVLDADAQKLASAEALGTDDWERFPQTYPTSPEYSPEYRSLHNKVLARWKDMTITLDGGRFYLNESGKDESL